MAAPEGVRTIDVGRVQRQHLATGAIVPAALGVVGVVCSITGAGLTDALTFTRVGVGVLGAALLLVAGAIGYLLVAHPPQSFLDVGADGLTLRGGKRGWTVSWDDVTGLVLVRSRLTADRHTSPRGLAVIFTLPRWFLRVQVGGRTRHWIDLGPRRDVLQEVQDALGARVRVDQSRPRPPST